MVQKSDEITLIGSAFVKGLAQQVRDSAVEVVMVLEANRDGLARMSDSTEYLRA